MQGGDGATAIYKKQTVSQGPAQTCTTKEKRGIKIQRGSELERQHSGDGTPRAAGRVKEENEIVTTGPKQKIKKKATTKKEN